MSANDRSGEVVLVTGFPTFLGRRLARKAIEADGRARVALLVREQHGAAGDERRCGLEQRDEHVAEERGEDDGA